MNGTIEEFRYLVLALQREGNRRLSDILATIGLTPSQAEVLRVLADFGELSLLELGERLVCESGSPSRLVNGMVKAKLVDKRPSPHDGRAVILSLSPEGRELLPQLDELENAYHQQLASWIEGFDLAQVIPLLRTMLAGTEAGKAVALRREKFAGEDTGKEAHKIRNQ